MKLSFNNFRRFHVSGAVEIAPITVLVGENSSGKSSFMAGLRYIVESMSQGAEASFNREPFFLGAYDQIAHYRGGRFGRSPNFSLGLELDNKESATFVRNSLFRHSSSTPTGFKTTLLFDNDQSQPSLRRIEAQNRHIELYFDRETFPSFSFRRKGDLSPQIVERDKQLSMSAGSGLGRNSLQPYSIALYLWTSEQSRAEQKDASRNLGTVGLNVFAAGCVYASSPFRTRPERTYSPVEAVASPEGSHIPMILAQAKSFEKNRWASIKEALDGFGRQSGMFKSIDVKRLSKSESDPFQIIVNIEKDKSNLVDVGYGVSQILPLVVETVINREAIFFMFQQPEVHLHPRGQAELGSFFVNFTREGDRRVVIETHSDFIIDRIRTDLIKNGLNPEKHLSLLFFDRLELETKIERINVDAKGNIVSPPERYRQFFLGESIRTLGLD